MKRKHFHSFDAFRFFAFLLVFLAHLPKTGLPYLDFLQGSGGIGVMFFFVLSGFLITYILLFEKKQQGTIALKKFFFRRMLRIWPLFYLLVAFGHLSPHILRALNISFTVAGYEPHLLSSLVFGENYRMMLLDSFPDGPPLRVMWSLCIEEHFYILWSLLLYFVPTKRIPLLIALSVVIAYIARAVYWYLALLPLDLFSHLDYFAFGAIPAYILLYKKEWIVYLGSVPRYLKYIFLLLTLGIIFALPNLNLGIFSVISPLLLCLFFSGSILFTLGENAIHINDNLWFSKLGIYTYGLYLYHSIIILLLVRVIDYDSLTMWFVFISLCFVGTLVVSLISYYGFERRFLKLKKYFY